MLRVVFLEAGWRPLSHGRLGEHEWWGVGNRFGAGDGRCSWRWEVDDWEEEASIAILGSSFSLGSGAATATANAEQAQSRGRNDNRSMGVHSRADHGVVGQP